LLNESDGMTTSELANKIGLSSRSVRTRLNALMKKGIIAVVGTSNRDPKRQYHLVRNNTE